MLKVKKKIDKAQLHEIIERTLDNSSVLKFDEPFYDLEEMKSFVNKMWDRLYE